jgi:hypothetical protein
MEPEIEKIYYEFVDARAARDVRYARVLNSINRTAGEFKVTLRPDAIYFLANNIVDIVFNPMLSATQRGLHLLTTKLVSEEELFHYIDHDLPTIIESTRTVADERERSEISAASVIVGLGRVIDHLHINNTKLWGRRFEPKL